MEMVKGRIIRTITTMSRQWIIHCVKRERADDADCDSDEDDANDAEGDNDDDKDDGNRTGVLVHSRIQSILLTQGLSHVDGLSLHVR